MGVTAPEGESPSEARKPRAFHVGLARRVGPTFVYKSAALIGLSDDGGVFVAPSQAPGPWRYGVLEGSTSALTTSVETPLGPKLHYHRSGLVFATLSGHDLERQNLQLAPLPGLRNSQIFSVQCVRTWELPARAKTLKLGDQLTAVKRWPDVATWTVFLLEASEGQRRPLLTPGLPSVGMLAGENFTHAIVSLSAYGREAVLLITVRTQDAWEGLPRVGGITVAALPWHPGEQTANDRCFGLWSSHLRNPMILWEESAPDDLTPTSTTSPKPTVDDIDRMAGFTVPDGGLGLRPPVFEYNDFSGTTFARPKGAQDPPRDA